VESASSWRRIEDGQRRNDGQISRLGNLPVGMVMSGLQCQYMNAPYAKLSIRSDSTVKIAPVHSDS
jgi:hypothetical protein